MSGTFGKGHHLHLIDGSAFIFRAYHALPPLTRKSDGLPIGAVAGFCNMLHRYVEGNTGPDAPTHAAVIFDKGSHTFRNEMYDLYKANREAMPEDLRPQIPLTRTATEAFNIACKEKEGFEADDIIATLAVQARAAGGRCTIISSDKDLMQLVGDGVEMLDAMKNKTIDRDGVFEKFGVFPERVVDVQALAGDSVDNVPGAPGIGIKTAALLINEYGDLETLLARAEEIKQPKRRQTLIDHAEQIRLSRRLVLLDENTPLDFTLDDLEVREPDADLLLGFLAEMEFRTLSKRVAEVLGREAPVIAETSPTLPDAPQADDLPFDAEKYEHVADADTLQKWIDAIYEVGYVAVDTETTGLNEMTAELVGISLSTEPGKACYIPLIHKAHGGDDLFGSDDLAEGQMPVEQALQMLTPMLEDPSILKIGQNMKYDAKIFAQIGITVAPFDDTMLMSYAQHAGLHNHGMDTLSERYLSHTPIPIKPLLGSGKSAITFDKVPLEEAVKYAAEDADITLRLWQFLKPQLHRAEVTKVYETLERPLVPVLAAMERSGIKVDRDTLSRMSNAFAQKMAGLEDEIYQIVGRKFNVGSPAQLGEILFDEMGIEGGKKGKNGKYSTGVDVLEDLATEHDLPARVLDWRQLSKLKSTYTDALQTHINPDTGRVHTSYSIAGASTGRLASTDPNLQNIPIRTEEGRRIREAFVAEEGKTLVALDYSQIELRILAHIADIPALKEAFARGDDIHAMTASEMFDVPMDEMTPEVRRRAKAINFGVIYGISGFGLARNLRIPRSEAQGFIDRYFERFPGIRTYMDDTKAFAKEHGYVQTLFGRKIHTPNIGAKGPHAGFAARAAINAPIQGTAADVIRRAMIRMPDAIADLPATMLLQVHDELLFEVEQGAEDTLIAAAREVMENANDPVVKLDVKLTVDAGTGANWAEAH
ncbi:DNA polymerase I [Sulfitobacter mediterraneus]|uniref:DNA polymerase I n=1 Tax=Sulfitobacter mediterraneus TaxID=83219 RepID=UPI0019314B18|nr:DNA polymerase I [Sulfitobacter mediterraneus]MBM1632753.1 DNA polymerase I [Sulfitobacter mediterraneus]MBM1641113.1 DNA polymerase I [Sulfitobacter mediterraneus]MBM1644618.1 DNA polymerase I [Sulfitobacter mediterraneus]MBM1649233.1 DNA polymerase I [Sulfitobacter mediterraneus]MBM1653254.1 DNA polymerase I [Sulfitobacter mediterraneus]